MTPPILQFGQVVVMERVLLRIVYRCKMMVTWSFMMHLKMRHGQPTRIVMFWIPSTMMSALHMVTICVHQMDCTILRCVKKAIWPCINLVISIMTISLGKPALVEKVQVHTV